MLDYPSNYSAKNGEFDLKFTPEAITAHWYKCTKNLQPGIVGLLIMDICLECLPLPGDHTGNREKRKYFPVDRSLVNSLWMISHNLLMAQIWVCFSWHSGNFKIFLTFCFQEWVQKGEKHESA